MSSEGTIAASNVWKRFRADRRRLLLRDEVERLGRRIRGHPGEEWRWALRDVNLVAGPGEAVGLVGSNGSGKSTLLKILGGVMYPYAGRVRTQGRVGALIEIRAGIHPDLTGRENVYLYGGLLGLPRRTVSARFDEIVDFADVSDAIDRQVRFYSSGMQLRLGFAVAALLEPDVLLVDEVLAVGDAFFQRRCLDRMRTVLAGGTTLVYVSHDLPTVEAVCTRGMWLEAGRVRAEGSVDDVLRAYRRSTAEPTGPGSGATRLLTLARVAVTSDGSATAQTQEPVHVDLTIESARARTGRLYVGVSDGGQSPIFLLGRDVRLVEGTTQVRLAIRRLPLPRGRYSLWVGVFAPHSVELLPWHPAAHFDVWGPPLDNPPRAVVRLAPVHVEAEWEMPAGPGQ
jgi:ABC-type polysaccharide/polyol phosphate transport system ATPase subunit